MAATYAKILIANDGSPGAAKALAAALALAKRFEAELHMISVEELPRFPVSIADVIEEQWQEERRLEAVIAQAQKAAAAEGVRLEAHIVGGHAVAAIVDFIERERFDLLVLGFMGHSALYDRVIGSTTDRLVDLAPCSVLVVK